MKFAPLYRLMIPILIAVSALIPSYCAFAGELRILDNNGLIRIIAEIKDPATVIIFSSATVDAENILLTNSNGLAADIAAQQSDPHSIIFNGVAEGLWKIDTRGKSLAVRKIEIKQ